MAAKLFLRESKSPLNILRCSNFSASLRTAAVFSQSVQNFPVLNRSPGSQGLDISNSASLLRGFSSGIGKLGGFVDSRLYRKLEYSSAAGKSKKVVDLESDVSDDSEDVDDSDMEDFVDEDDSDFDEEDSLDDDDDDEVIHKRRK